MSDRALASILNELDDFREYKLETGGVFLGVIDNDDYYIIESSSPGMNAVHRVNSFEYDAEFIGYISTKHANIYKHPLEVIGLWHTHWDGENMFSEPDNMLNHKFVDAYKTNIISLLITESDQLMMKAYLVDSADECKNINIQYGDLNIPKEYLKYQIRI